MILNVMSLKKTIVLIIANVISLFFVMNLYGKEKVTTAKKEKAAVKKETATKMSPMCKIDLNGDKAEDFVFLIHGWKAFVLLTKGKKYELHLVTDASRLGEWTILSCRKGFYVLDFFKRKTKNQKVKIPEGSYFEIDQLEGATSVYYWKDGAFKEVWTSD